MLSSPPSAERRAIACAHALFGGPRLARFKNASASIRPLVIGSPVAQSRSRSRGITAHVTPKCPVDSVERTPEMVCGGWRDVDSVSIRRLRGFIASLRSISSAASSERHDITAETSRASERRRAITIDWGERRRSEQLRWRCASLSASRSDRRGAAPRWQDHEQRCEQRAPVAGSVLERGSACLAVGVAISVKQLSRETRRLLRGDAIFPGCRAQGCRRRSLTAEHDLPPVSAQVGAAVRRSSTRRETVPVDRTRPRVGGSTEAEVVRSNRLRSRELIVRRPRGRSARF